MKLKDICKFVNEKVDTSSFHLEDYVSTENLLPNKGGVTVASKIPQGKATLFKKGDILISNIRPYFKKIYLAKKQGCCSNDVLCIRPNSNIPSSYLYYLLSQDSFFDYVMTGAKGTKMPRGDKGHIMNWAVYQSTLSQQQNIAEILTPLDDKIAVNSRICANLEAQAEALFKSWFVDFTPFKDQPFVDSELGPIPQGWKVGTLGDIALQSTEKVLTRNDVKVLSPITTGKLVLSEEYFTKQVFSKSIRNYKIVKQGAFAYNPARVNIGSLGMNEFKFDGCVSPVYVVFECLKGYSFFFDLFRKTDFFKQAVISFAIGGVRQTLNYSDFALIDATIPPLNIVQSFNEIYLHLKKKISINEEENQRLAALRDTLLPKLMSGEIKL